MRKKSTESGSEIGDKNTAEKNPEQDSRGRGDACGCGGEHLQEMALPQPGLIVLGEMLFAQGMLAAGTLPNPYSQEIEQDLRMAQFQIRLMEVLEEKTRGNRSEMENKTLEEMLHALKMSYLEASSGGAPRTK